MRKRKSADVKELHFLNLSKKRRRRRNMSLALHGHHVLIIATLAFAAAVLTPNWFTAKTGTKINVFKICPNSSVSNECPWIFSQLSDNSTSSIGGK